MSNNIPSLADPVISKNTNKSENTRWIDLIQGATFILIVALYAGLMLTDRVPTLGLVAVAALWLVYLLLSGRLNFSTPLDLPILVMLGLLPLSLAVSIDRELSLPKIYGLVLGIVMFCLIVNNLRNYDRLHLAVLALIILAIGTAALGLISINATSEVLSFLPPLQNLLRRIQPGSFAVGNRGVNANTIGGALTFFVPLLGSLLWNPGAFNRSALRTKSNRDLLFVAYKVLVFGAFLFVLGVLILTRSRSAYLGCAVGFMALLIFKDRRFIWLIPILLANAIFVIYYFGDGDPLAFLYSLDTSRETTLQDRFALWSSAVGIIQDFPITGAGIFTFSKVLGEVYTAQIFEIQPMQYFHAHNLYLAIAFDLGIPGLVLYTALLSSFGVMAYRTINRGRSIIRVVVVGLVSGMVAHHAFGLIDANTLGTKLGIILWIFLGLMAALYTHKRYRGWRTDSQAGDQPGLAILNLDWKPFKRRLRDLLFGLVLWVIISLAAVTFITLNPILSIVLAIAGGILLGILLAGHFMHGSIRGSGETKKDRNSWIKD
ncbi:MAG: O-antigen ligase family protein [Brevefilum sp.]|nr:O-antigen ligase family protein [Brevefilum sp.]